VIEPENAEALTQAITQLAADRDLRTKLGQQGREYILQNFSRGRTAEKYIQVLQRVVEKAHGA
jgi:glycosyltransferase involved in cell wall biosynthesis